jgi:hypothetical protein
MRRIIPLFILLLLACRAPAEDRMELRTYEVPKGTVRALEATIKDVLYLDKPIGRATVTPDGRLAVLAPSTVQPDVQTLIDEVKKNPPTYEGTIELHYWVVVGKPASSPQPPPPGSEEIKAALDAITKAAGPQGFTIVSKARFPSLHNEKSALEADQLKVIQTAVHTHDGVYARIIMDARKGNQIETHVHLQPNASAVLAATGQHGPDVPEGTTLYYVVRLADGKQP